MNAELRDKILARLEQGPIDNSEELAADLGTSHDEVVNAVKSLVSF